MYSLDYTVHASQTLKYWNVKMIKLLILIN